MNNAVAVTTASVSRGTNNSKDAGTAMKCGKICMTMQENGVKQVTVVKIQH
jgi:hypothetical protein